MLLKTCVAAFAVSCCCGVSCGLQKSGILSGGSDAYAETSNPEGNVKKSVFRGKVRMAGAPVMYSTCVMKGADTGNAPLFLMMEFDEKSTLRTLEDFAAEGLIPPGLVVFLANGLMYPSMKGGFPRYMRGTMFGHAGRDFADMIIDEFLPHVSSLAGVRISSDPDMHFIAGSSAGGGATVNMVWYRSDYFRRAYAISPVVDPLLPMFVRITEAKPFRIYLTVGDNEPDRSMGDLFFSSFQLRAALDYSGYPCELEYFPKGGHNAGKGQPETMRRMVEFTWKGWNEGRIVPPRNPIRVESLVDDGGWREVSVNIPPKKDVRIAIGEYAFEGGMIAFTGTNGVRRTVADGFGRIEGISLSSDMWRLYVVDADRRSIFAVSISPDGSLGYPFRHADIMLHPDAKRIGASDILTLENDRMLVATELGVQSATSFGALDVILPLPGEVPAGRIWMEGKMLFAAGGGKVFKRKLKLAEADETKISQPDKSYYIIPGENRNSGHLEQLAPALDAIRSIVITNRIAR